MKTKFFCQKSGSMKTMSVRIFVVSFLLPSFLLLLILLALYAKETIASQEKEYVNTLNILSSHLVNNMNADSSLSLTYLFETDTADFYYFLNEKDYTEDLYAYSMYERDYISDMNSRVTLLGDSMIGIGFLPYEANENRLFYLRKYDSLEVMENYCASEKGWYRYMDKNNQRPVFTPSDLEEETAISLVRTVKDIDRQKIIGYVIVDISLDFIRESLDNITISPYSGIFLYSPQKELLFATSRDLVPVVERLRTRKIRGAGGMDNYDLYSFTDDEFGFTLYYLSSRVDLYRSLTFAVLLALAFYFGMLVIAAVLFGKTQHRLRSSIDLVLSTMDKYHAGDSRIRCDAARCSISEISTIATTLNEMIEKINRHIDNEYKFKMEQKAAEYQALQAEINPHFLHNILNLLIAMNRVGDRRILEQSIISLSHMFRYTCEHNFNSTIRQEFDFIQDYLFLQKSRLEERLNFQIWLEPGMEDFEIPKLLIQPLVENAVVHGIEPSENNEYIRLSAFTAEARGGRRFAAVMVINSGRPYTGADQGKRVGLKNIEDRLAIFSPDAFFIVRGGIGKPTRCVILIPIP